MPNLKSFYKLFRQNSKGFSLLEVLIAIALLGVIGISFLGALSTTSRVLLMNDERATAESLARSQMEYVKNQLYAAFYSSAIPQDYVDAGYSATIDVELLDDPDNGFFDDIQKIAVNIYHHDDAHANPPVITLEDYKVDRR